MASQNYPKVRIIESKEKNYSTKGELVLTFVAMLFRDALAVWYFSFFFNKKCVNRKEKKLCKAVLRKINKRTSVILQSIKKKMFS